MRDSSKQELCLNNFQLSKISELDYESLAALIDKKKEFTDLKSYIKDSNHSLFSPILVYSISFLKNKKI